MGDLKEEIRIRDGVQLSTSVTSNPIVIKNRIKKGRIPFPKKLFEMVYIEDVNKEEMSLHKSLGYQIYKSIKKIINTKPQGRIDFGISEINRFGKEADIFCARAINLITRARIS
jgi:hypothetical protein